MLPKNDVNILAEEVENNNWNRKVTTFQILSQINCLNSQKCHQTIINGNGSFFATILKI